MIELFVAAYFIIGGVFAVWVCIGIFARTGVTPNISQMLKLAFLWPRYM